jgi:invasion protein IalB
MISKWKQAMVVAAMLLPLGLVQAAGAKQGQRFGNWGVQCETGQNNQQVCYLQQVLSEKNKQEPLMVTVVGYGPGKPFPTAIFELPKGINIQQGVQLRVDKYKPVGFSGKCDNNGCRAGFTLDNPLTQQFSKGQQALIAFTKHGQKEPVILPVSLKGMAYGLKMIK